MAYVIWRVVMKKYSRVRLGLHGSGVTPTGGRAITYDEESWKPSLEEKSKEKEDFNRLSEARQSKTKRVKNYLKKCKNVLGSRSASLEVSSCSDASATSSWYVENKLNECEINEIEEIFEDAQVSPSLGDASRAYQVANIIEVRGPSAEDSDSGKTSEENVESKGSSGDNESNSVQETSPAETDSNVPDTASPSLKESQDKEEGDVEGTEAELKEKDDVLDIEIPIKLIYTNNRKCLKSTTKFNHHVRLVYG